MKAIKYLFIVIIFLLNFCEVSGEELPLTLTADYDANGEEVLVQITAAEPVAIEAFTFTVTYNRDLYKLYKGNDVILQGYGYYEAFQKAYQKNGMLISNALDGKVLFSGVHNYVPDPFQGIIAEVSLLKYNNAESADTDINLEIQLLRINGENKTGETVVIPSVSSEKLPPSEEPENPGCNTDPVQNQTEDNTSLPLEQAGENNINASENQTSSAASLSDPSESGAGDEENEDTNTSQAGTEGAVLPESGPEVSPKSQRSLVEEDSKQSEPSEKDSLEKGNTWKYVTVTSLTLAAVAAGLVIYIRKKGLPH